MSLSKNRRLFAIVPFLALPLAALGAFPSCVHDSPVDTESEPELAVNDGELAVALEAEAAVEAEAAAKLVFPDPCGIAPACDPSLGASDYPVSPSLVLTRNTESIPGSPDAPILDAHFQLADVVDQLISQAGVTESANEWLQRLWDTQNQASGVFTESFAPHCSDNGQTINGFPVDCPREEGRLAGKVQTADFTPIAVFNRFDLAPVDGSHCGEYRIIYAMNVEGAGGVGGRNFIIFEGQLPNPDPGCGVQACRPVVDFWRNLSTLGSQTDIGDALHHFYFDGIDGFTPVVEIHHYGFNDGKSVAEGGYGSSGGQIRTNQFADGPLQQWQLREFHLDRQCDGSDCKLFAAPVTVQNNPFFNLFDVSSTLPLAGGFQADFANPGASQVASLATLDPNVITNLNTIAMNIDNQFNAGQSTSDGLGEAYMPQFQPGPDPFHDAVQNELTAVGSGLTPEEIISRAETQSCKGCHQLSNNVAIGDGLTWPASNKFTHVNEDGTRSQALRCVFLPHRQAVGLAFLQSCGTSPSPVVPGDPDCSSFGGKNPLVSGGAAQAQVIGQAGSKPVAPNMVKTIGGGSQVN